MKYLKDSLKKNYWYLFLLISTTMFIYSNREVILNVKITDFTAYSLIFLIWLVLLLFPLFSEIELVGVKLRKELAKTKEELSQEIKEIRMDLKLSNSNTLNFGNEFLPSIEKLRQMQNILNYKTSQAGNFGKEETLESQLKEKKEYKFPLKFEISDENIFLFKVRSYLEQNLIDICNKLAAEKTQDLNEMVRFLNHKKIINERIADLWLEIIKISSRGIHGEILSIDYINFVQDVLPEVEKVFEIIKNKIENINT